MIILDSLLAVDELIVHDNCSDGTASAMILRDVYPNAKVTFMQYETEAHKNLEPKRGQLFCDLSPHRDRYREFLDAEVIVLDHHKTAKGVVMPFVEAGLGAFGDEITDPGVCGAVLAYREVWAILERERLNAVFRTLGEFKDVRTTHVFKSQAFEQLAVLAGIRDTWQKNDPRFREACEQADAIHFWPWNKIEDTSWQDWGNILAIGPILYDRSLKHVDKSLAGAHKFVSEKGRLVTVFEGVKPTSDAAEKQGSDCDLTVGFALFVEDGQQKIIFSTRSRGDFDCSAFAAAHGGGGHTRAAGFNHILRPMDLQPFALVEQLVRNYEGVEDDWKVLFNSEEYKNKTLPKDVYPKIVQKYLWERFSST